MHLGLPTLPRPTPPRPRLRSPSQGRLAGHPCGLTHKIRHCAPRGFLTTTVKHCESREEEAAEKAQVEGGLAERPRKAEGAASVRKAGCASIGVPRSGLFLAWRGAPEAPPAGPPRSLLQGPAGCTVLLAGTGSFCRSALPPLAAAPRAFRPGSLPPPALAHPQA